MHSSVWGGAYWYLLHAITFSFNKEAEHNKQDFKAIIERIGKILPCGVCRGHFARLMKKHKMKIDSHKELTLWLYERHNYLNKLLQKRNRPSYEAVVKHHNNNFNNSKVKKFFRFFLMFLNDDRITHYKTIYKLFKTTWPKKSQRSTIKAILETKTFKTANTSDKLRRWHERLFKKYILNNKPYKMEQKTPPASPTPPTDHIQNHTQNPQLKKVTFDVPKLTTSKVIQHREELKTKQQNLIQLKSRLVHRHLYNAKQQKRMMRRHNNLTLRIKNLKSTLTN